MDTWPAHICVTYREATVVSVAMLTFGCMFSCLPYAVKHPVACRDFFRTHLRVCAWSRSSALRYAVPHTHLAVVALDWRLVCRWPATVGCILTLFCWQNAAQFCVGAMLIRGLIRADTGLIKLQNYYFVRYSSLLVSMVRVWCVGWILARLCISRKGQHTAGNHGGGSFPTGIGHVLHDAHPKTYYCTSPVNPLI